MTALLHPNLVYHPLGASRIHICIRLSGRQENYATEAQELREWPVQFLLMSVHRKAFISTRPHGPVSELLAQQDLVSGVRI